MKKPWPVWAGVLLGFAAGFSLFLFLVLIVNAPDQVVMDFTMPAGTLGALLGGGLVAYRNSTVGAVKIRPPHHWSPGKAALIGASIGTPLFLWSLWGTGSPFQADPFSSTILGGAFWGATVAWVRNLFARAPKRIPT